MVLTRFPVALIVLLCTLGTVETADAFQRRGSDNEEVAVGNQAPPLPEGVWVGEKPDLQAPTVKVLFFWEPSYTGTRLAMPLLSQLQQRWGTNRLRILGFGVERPPKDYNAEKVPTVEPFVIRQGPRVKFPNSVIQDRDVSRTWMRKRPEPYFLVIVVNEEGKIQAITSPLDEELNDIVAKLISGRYEVSVERFAEPYRAEMEKYRRNRDWTQYKLVLGRLVERGSKYFAKEELDYLVSVLTEQDDPVLGQSQVSQWIMERSTTDPDFLGMLAERLANDPLIPDDRRMLALAAQAALESHNAAESSEARAVALGRMALVNVRQGNDAIARE